MDFCHLIFEKFFGEIVVITVFFSPGEVWLANLTKIIQLVSCKAKM